MEMFAKMAASVWMVSTLTRVNVLQTTLADIVWRTWTNVLSTIRVRTMGLAETLKEDTNVSVSMVSLDPIVKRTRTNVPSILACLAGLVWTKLENMNVSVHLARLDSFAILTTSATSTPANKGPGVTPTR